MAELTPYVYGKDYEAGKTETAWCKPKEGSDQTLTGGYRYNNRNWVICLRFEMPENASAVTLGFFSIANANGGANSDINYKVTTEEDAADYVNATSAIAGDGTFTVNNPKARTVLTINRTFLAGTTYYIYFWTANPTSDTTNLFRTNWRDNANDTGFYASYEPIGTYTLYTSTGEGTGITVNRTSSPVGATGRLVYGEALYTGDVLQISFSVQTGYRLTKHTVNHSTFRSGDSYIVESNVSIVTEAVLLTFALAIAASTGGTVVVNRTRSGGGSTGALSDGETLYYGDVLTVTYSPSLGYVLKSATLNEVAIESGASHTVTGDVAIVVAFDLVAGVVYVDTGESIIPCYAYVDTGTTMELLSIYADTGSEISPCH